MIPATLNFFNTTFKFCSFETLATNELNEQLDLISNYLNCF